MIRTPWMSSSYKRNTELKTITRNIDGHQFIVLINPDYGSWAVFTPEDYERYENDNLTEVEMETLYLRGLALSDDGETIELDFPAPAEYPSIVVVNITTTCNLRCKYCFADCEPQVGEFMQPNVMGRIITEMLKMPVNVITFEFSGGEPLCNLDGIKQFIDLAENLKQQSDKVVQYRIVTNCTLITDDFIQLAKKYNILVGISVDGPKNLTDPIRIKEDGTGAFDDILDGIKKLEANGIPVNGAVCTIGQHNVMFPDEIVDFFAEHNISFKPRPSNILGREIVSNTTTKPGEWAEAYKKMYHLSKQKNVENFSIHIFEENVYGPIRDYICLRYPCGAAREVITVNPDGSVYPCDGFKGVEDFNLGNILTEDLSDILNNESVRKLKNRTAKDIEKCSKCLYRAMCCSCCYSAFGKFSTVYREDPHCADRRLIFNFLIDEWIKNNVLGK